MIQKNRTVAHAHKCRAARPIALVPAYKPERVLLEVAASLLSGEQFAAVVVVDDGSGADYLEIFSALERMGCRVLRHCVNLGKGMALRTGLNYAAAQYPDTVGIVTFDADGQHLSKDIEAVGSVLLQKPHSLIMGVRKFGRDIPLRSYLGNTITRNVMALLGGIRVSDTQTGLRGIPLLFVPELLHLFTMGYDFELDMLLRTKQKGIPIVEVPIETVYLDANASSHFNPLLDSMKIYLVFLRFNISSLLTAAIDYIIFTICILSGYSILAGIICGRIIAGFVNFSINKKFVFKSDNNHFYAIIAYAMTVLLSGCIGWVCIEYMVITLSMNVYLAKVLIEILLYIFNFIIQRDFVFKKMNI